MGKGTAPQWATLFFGIKESSMNGEKGFLKLFEAVLSIYKHYMDDILGIWLKYPDPLADAQIWKEFKDNINDFHGLKWTFTEHTKSDVIFIDMSLSIEKGRITLTIY